MKQHSSASKLSHDTLFYKSVSLNVHWFSAILVVKYYTTGFFSKPTPAVLLSAVLTNGYHICSLLCLEYLNPISHSIANVFKRVFTIVSALMYFHEAIELPTFIGLEIAFFGLLLYSQTKSHQIRLFQLLGGSVMIATILALVWVLSASNSLPHQVSQSSVPSIPNSEALLPSSSALPSVSLSSDPLMIPSPSVSPTSESPTVTVYTWSFSSSNFGDALGPEILKRVLEHGCTCNVTLVSTTVKRRLLTIGSIFHFARPGDVIWGSGVRAPNKVPDSRFLKSLDVLYLRGPRSESIYNRYLGGNATQHMVYGDPGLLFGCVFPKYLEIAKTKRECRNDTTGSMFVYHKSSRFNGTEDWLQGLQMINAMSPWRKVVQEIACSSFVASSSLHGLVIAESLHKPARFVNQWMENEPDFKYLDYYLGTGRPDDGAVRNISEALRLGGLPKPFFNSTAVLTLLFDAIPLLVERGIMKIGPGCKCSLPHALVDSCRQEFEQ